MLTSGPGSQRVLNRWRKGFGHYLAQQGYVVINSDGRGTNARGRQWRNETYMRLGQKEADDQLSTAHFAASLAFVDPERIAIIGWSYGGYQAIRTMSEKEDRMIKCGVAIAPVTDWRLYDTGYTERYFRNPEIIGRVFFTFNKISRHMPLDMGKDVLGFAERCNGDGIKI